MSKGLFITATGTDIGKTYVTALLVKKMREAGVDIGYYKAALSGADSIADSDAGYVNKIGKIGQKEDTLLSYLYKNAVSPHLAAKIEGNPVEKDVVKADYKKVSELYSYVVVEGSGGIVCPIRYDEEKKYFLEDIIKWLHLPALVVADAGLGTINAVVLTVEYLQRRNITVGGIILNNYTDTVMQQDNKYMIEEITKLPVLGVVEPQATDLKIDVEVLKSLFK